MNQLLWLRSGESDRSTKSQTLALLWQSPPPSPRHRVTQQPAWSQIHHPLTPSPRRFSSARVQTWCCGSCADWTALLRFVKFMKVKVEWALSEGVPVSFSIRSVLLLLLINKTSTGRHLTRQAVYTCLTSHDSCSRAPEADFNQWL